MVKQIKPESTDIVAGNGDSPPHQGTLYADADLSKPHPKRAAPSIRKWTWAPKLTFLKTEPVKQS